MDEIYTNGIFKNPLVMLTEKNTRDSVELLQCRTIEMGTHAIITAEGKVNICPPLSRCGEIGDLIKIEFSEIWNSYSHNLIFWRMLVCGMIFLLWVKSVVT